MTTLASSLRAFAVSTLLSLGVYSTSLVAADAASPGQIDLGTFAPPSEGGQFVEVNIQKNLLQIAARFVAREEPAVAELLRGLHAVRVHVIGMDEGNRADLEKRAATLRGQLDAQGWQQVVAVRDSREQVGVYLKIAEDETIQGITVVVLDGGSEAVFVNISGSIRPEQIATLGESLGIDPLKHLHLEMKSAAASGQAG